MTWFTDLMSPDEEITTFGVLRDAAYSLNSISEFLLVNGRLRALDLYAVIFIDAKTNSVTSDPIEYFSALLGPEGPSLSP